MTTGTVNQSNEGYKVNLMMLDYNTQLYYEQDSIQTTQPLWLNKVCSPRDPVC